MREMKKVLILHGYYSNSREHWFLKFKKKLEKTILRHLFQICRIHLIQSRNVSMAILMATPVRDIAIKKINK
jgi:hypothetical protein